MKTSIPLIISDLNITTYIYGEENISQNVMYSNIYSNHQEFAPVFFANSMSYTKYFEGFGDRPVFSSVSIEAAEKC